MKQGLDWFLRKFIRAFHSVSAWQLKSHLSDLRELAGNKDGIESYLESHGDAIEKYFHYEVGGKNSDKALSVMLDILQAVFQNGVDISPEIANKFYNQLLHDDIVDTLSKTKDASAVAKFLKSVPSTNKYRTIDEKIKRFRKELLSNLAEYAFNTASELLDENEDVHTKAHQKLREIFDKASPLKLSWEDPINILDGGEDAPGKVMMRVTFNNNAKYVLQMEVKDNQKFYLVIEDPESLSFLSPYIDEPFRENNAKRILGQITTLIGKMKGNVNPALECH